MAFVDEWEEVPAAQQEALEAAEKAQRAVRAHSLAWILYYKPQIRLHDGTTTAELLNAPTLAKPGDEINVTVLRLRKYYQEKIEFGSSNEMPPRANTAEEVRALGGSLIYGHDRYFQEVCDVMLAIEAPENLNEEQSQFFAYNVGGKNYTLAMYTVAASAYTSLAKRLFTDAALLLRAGLYTGSYKIHSELRKNGTNSWHVPVASFSGKHDEPTAESFKKLAGI